MNKPYELTAQEWGEVAAVRDVVEGWGLDDDAEEVRGALLASLVYGVRFDYVTDGPGYAGSLYLLKGGGAPEIPPMALVETDDGLRVVEWD
ncbi:hypothetical protein [Brevundimonas sp.]|uniref:hypothetical protein n=1 Tax=Brevundimonas sp. TaxID=1871086 RepID=UPI003F72501E